MNKVVRTIPATRRMYTSEPLLQNRKKRVAAYARVSSDSEEQLTSYETQVSYYDSYIKSRCDWEYVNVYTDEGISGTNTKYRTGFNNMIADALAGKIDLIITKSVSRFARNTVDSLTTIRKLKEHKVECFFEKENIWTFDSKGELLLTIMSSLAQEESRSISENVKWGKRKAFAEGKVWIPFATFLGYKRGENGEIIVDEEQAKLVRYIYALYVQGLSFYSLAKRLNEEGYRTAKGNKWASSSIKSVLTNEKYKGDALLQKTYIGDYLTKKQILNQGEIPQYYVKGNHEAIVTEELFDYVQEEIKRRGRGKYSGISCFSNKIQCGQCNNFYGSKVWHSNSKYRRVIFRCNEKYKGKDKCSTRHVSQEEIESGFVKAVNKLLKNKNVIVKTLTELVDMLTISDKVKDQEQMELELLGIEKQLETLVQRNATVLQDQNLYETEYEKLSNRYNALSKELATYIEESQSKAARLEKLRMFIIEFEKQKDVVTEFNKNQWCALIEKVVVTTDGKLQYIFKDGSEVMI